MINAAIQLFPLSEASTDLTRVDSEPLELSELRSTLGLVSKLDATKEAVRRQELAFKETPDLFGVELELKSLKKRQKHLEEERDQVSSWNRHH